MLTLFNSNSIQKSHLFRSDLDSKFLWISSTYNTLLRVKSFPKVTFRTTLPWPLISEVAEIFINNFSPFSSTLNEVNNYLSDYTCPIASMLIYLFYVWIRQIHFKNNGCEIYFKHIVCHVVNFICFFLTFLLRQYVIQKFIAYFVTFEAVLLKPIHRNSTFLYQFISFATKWLRFVLIGIRSLIMLHNICFSYNGTEPLLFRTFDKTSINSLAISCSMFILFRLCWNNSWNL